MICMLSINMDNTKKMGVDQFFWIDQKFYFSLHCRPFEPTNVHFEMLIFQDCNG
jgi:hypothetical protein